MPTLCRAVLGGTALLTAALALAACTSMGQGMAESTTRANAARYGAKESRTLSQVVLPDQAAASKLATTGTNARSAARSSRTRVSP